MFSYGWRESPEPPPHPLMGYGTGLPHHSSFGKNRGSDAQVYRTTQPYDHEWLNRLHVREADVHLHTAREQLMVSS